MRQLTIVPPFIALLLSLNACGTMAPPPESKAERPRTGLWSQEYTGECAGRESETLHISQLDETEIVFDDFRLLRDEEGQYSGGANFIAPMPEDERDVIYTIVYDLRGSEDGGFIGTETIIEGGGHSLGCPIELVFVNAE